jgi:hypothetical protein
MSEIKDQMKRANEALEQANKDMCSMAAETSSQNKISMKVEIAKGLTNNEEKLEALWKELE